MLGGPEGPVLKNARNPGYEEKFMDPGFWVNSKEFAERLLSKLKGFSL
jgi:hypothetical protein